jgi:hypothetical protein
MRQVLKDQSGAALLTILLFMVIVAILLTTMLTVSGNESIISALHRDGVQAKEVAEGGLAEGLTRLGLGHPFALNSAADCYDADPSNDVFFTNSLTPEGGAQVRVCLLDAGAGGVGAIWEVQSNAQVGMARRRLSVIALQTVLDLLPNVVYGHDCSQGGSAEIRSGDVYCQTYVKHKTDESAGRLTYGGWFVKKEASGGPAVGPCYTHDACVALGYSNWWPGHRRAIYKDDAINQQLGEGSDDRILSTYFSSDGYKPVGGAPALVCPTGLQDRALFEIDPAHPLAGLTVSDLPAGANWQSGDNRQDNTAMPSGEKLYGCAKDGRPYTWVREAFDGDDNDNPPVDDQFMWFKTIEFEDWKSDYWIFCRAVGDPVPACTAEFVLTFIKNSTLQSDPSLGAVPPFPDFDSLDNNYHERVTGGGTLTGADGIDWGTCVEGSDGIANNCDGAASDPRVILLTEGDYRVNANIEAHGTVLVGPNQDLEVNGTFTCWCVLIIDGNLKLGNGTVTIYGGLIAKNTAELNGNITVYAGGSVTSVPVGSGPVTGLSWWQR